MARDDVLPFARGSTYLGLTATATAAQEADSALMLGRECVVADDTYPSLKVTLMAVRYNAGTPGTSLTAATKMVDYVAGSLEQQFSDQAPSAEGKVSHPLDWKYSGATIYDGDVVWVVKSGPCKISTTGNPSALANVVTQTDGTVDAAAAGDDHVAGYMLADAASNVGWVMFGGQCGIE